MAMTFAIYTVYARAANVNLIPAACTDLFEINDRERSLHQRAYTSGIIRPTIMEDAEGLEIVGLQLE